MKAVTPVPMLSTGEEKERGRNEIGVVRWRVVESPLAPCEGVVYSLSYRCINNFIAAR